MSGNPKLVGSNIIDCIPQTGECPNRCSECFYNGGRFYRTLDEPEIPSFGVVGDRIVRVNSGNDSNNNRDHVIQTTKKYRHKFYNTARPRFDFPGPVVLTLNPQWNNSIWRVRPVPSNLMFVRVRANIQDGPVVSEALDWYGRLGVPVVVTFMRYYSKEVIGERLVSEYEYRKHITNGYWVPKPEAIVRFMKGFVGMGLRMCGTSYSSFCVDCGHCEEFYWRTIKRMGDASQSSKEGA